MLRGIARAALDIDAFGNAGIVCRLTAPLAVMQERIRARERGFWQQKYVDRVAVLEDALDKAALEDFSLVNDGTRRITDVAGEILQRAGWGGP